MTELEQRAGQIHRGLGVVARWPNIALVIPSDAAHDAAVDDMFHQLGPHPEARQIVSIVQRMLAAEQLKSVAIVVEATGGPLAMAFGPVEILVDGQVVLSGAQGGVRQQLPAAAHRLTLRAADLDKAAEPVAPYDLRRGVAPGAGLTLIVVGVADPTPTPGPAPSDAASTTTTDADNDDSENDNDNNGEPAAEASTPEAHEPAPEPVSMAAPAPGPVEPTPLAESRPDEPVTAGAVNGAADPQAGGQDPTPQAEPEEAPFTSVLLIGSPKPEDCTPLPRADEPSRTATATDVEYGRVEVQGVLCPRQHFNNPEAENCMVCGLSIAHLGANLVGGLQPTLGFIVFDDGATFGLDRSYVIGREPHRPKGSSAQLLVLSDNNDTLSRTHASLDLDAWQVRLTDLTSTNGTYVWDVAAEQWNQLSPGQAVELRSGDTVALGRRTFVFESVGRN